ncbi:hypothetical protein F4818DRAFT_456408 [Hypoxylon cercidicola]|nr:hypothetical protein F4818DRAFT_456408 [Hypoxylon cercidicola]
MCGIALSHAGHNVKIIERDGDTRLSHKSGVCLGPSVIEFLARHDCSVAPFFSETDGLQITRGDATHRAFIPGRRIITSWDAFYYRLRHIFDGYTSTYCEPQLPDTRKSGGTASYISNAEVVDIKPVVSGTGELDVTLVTPHTSGTLQERADFVIGADGPGSFVRAKYIPAVQRRYEGYVAWRGTVPECEVSPSTLQAFGQGVTLHLSRQQHCVLYLIPGPNGSLHPGERLLNFLWYTNEGHASLDEIMVDAIDGHRHRYTVPAGRVRPEVWSQRVERAKRLGLPPAWLEVIAIIRQPFVQVISQCHSPRATFEDGKVLLVGDALSLLCPHTGLSGSQAAFHSMKVADYISGKMSAHEWERTVVGYSYMYWLQSVAWGRSYQSNTVTALVASLHYWSACGWEKLIMWWEGKASNRPDEFSL